MKPVTLKISGKVVCYNLPSMLKEKIHKELTFENPVYKEAVDKGRFISSATPQYLYFYATNSDRSIYQIHRGYIYYLKKWLKKFNYKVNVIDNTISFDKMNLNFFGTLRDYQELGVNDMVSKYPLGVLEASTGAGKTVMGCGIMARRRQPTLIMVHNKELLYQWRDAIKKFLHYDCGLLGDGNKTVKEITVGIINTVRNMIDELTPLFGQIILDECHRAPGNMFSETLPKFPARHYLGLSATPFRRDGLGHVINACIGPKLHTVDKEMLHDSGAVLRPVIIRVNTAFRYMFTDNYSTMIKSLTESEQRNKLICDTVSNDIKQRKQNVLIVSDRVAHCKEIARILKEQYRLDSRVLVSSVKKENRTQIVDDVRSGKCKILISTINLIGEGFDAPALASLFLTTPIKFSGRLIQVVGRVLRPEDDKIPNVYDFRDNSVNVLKYSGFNRDRIYKKQWG